MPTGTLSRSPSPRSRRGRSRSRSRSRSASYDSYTDDYSDSYYSDDDRGKGGKNAKDKTATIRKPPQGKASVTKKSPPKKGAAGKGGKVISKEQDYVARRVMSARRLKINDLKNENEDMKQQLVDLQRENKLLARTAALQDRKLHQYEDQEGEMPRIIAKHTEELRAAREQVRRQKEKLSKTESKLKETDDELDRNKRLLKKMKGLVEDKQLDERDNLARKLSTVEADLEDKEHKLKNLERHVENLQKNHKHELGIERARYKELQKDVHGLKDQSNQLIVDLKDARRDLDVQNIYANRALRAGRSSTRNSTLSTPAPLPKNPAHQRKNSDPPGMTPREKAKQFEMQRRAQERKQRDERQSRLSEEPSYQPDLSQEPSRNTQNQSTNKPNDDWWQQMQLQKQREEEEERRAGHREEEEREEEWRQSRERLKHDAELNARQERDRQEREEQDRLEHERRARQEREEREEGQKRENEERMKREREERDRQEHERREREEEAARRERDRLANDEKERERTRQKNSLLAKMAALEKKEDNNMISDPFAPQPKPVKKVDEIFDDPFAVPSSRKDNKRSDKVQPSPTRRRGSGNSYSFGKPIENLHNGKPAYEDVSVPVLERNKKRNQGIFDDDDFSYQPSFGSANRNSAGKPKTDPDKSKQKKNLMNDLFGGSSTTAKSNNKVDPDDSVDFGGSSNIKKAGGSNRRANNDFDLFANSDSPPHNNSHLLPRRGRQPATTFTSPAINAVDHFDDDIEEMVL